MTEREPWKIQPTWVWGVSLWLTSAIVIVSSAIIEEWTAGLLGLLLSAMAATYTVCAVIDAKMADQRRMFELGREAEVHQLKR